jgi:cyclopropane fatty-acyl-phospholipid synthase-like methyltransferase
MAAYGRLCTLFHDADQPRASAEEVAWYVERLPRDAGPVLEAMAGSGRLLVPLLERRINVHGVDASPAMVASCEARLAAARLSTPLFRQDVVALNLPFRYGAAIVAAGSFQLLTDPSAARKALERLRAHLVAPGRLFMDLYVPAEATHPPGAPEVRVQTVTLNDGSKLARRAEVFVDAEGRRIDIRSRYEQRERATITAREDETLAVTWYGEDEIIALVRDAGYLDAAIGPPASPLEANSPPAERRFSVTAVA